MEWAPNVATRVGVMTRPASEGTFVDLIGTRNRLTKTDSEE